MFKVVSKLLDSPGYKSQFYDPDKILNTLLPKMHIVLDDNLLCFVVCVLCFVLLVKVSEVWCLPCVGKVGASSLPKIDEKNVSCILNPKLLAKS